MRKFRSSLLLIIISIICFSPIAESSSMPSSKDVEYVEDFVERYKNKHEDYDFSRFIAHRGFADYLPENTAAAYKAAGMLGFNGIEGDVRMTKDGHLYMMHNPSILEMTGVDQLVVDIPKKQLKKYKITGGNNIKKFEDLRICSFREFLKICKKYDCIAIVDLKIHSKENERVKMCRKIFREIKRQNMEKETIIFSSSVEMLTSYRKADKKKVAIRPFAKAKRQKENLKILKSLYYGDKPKGFIMDFYQQGE